MAQVRAKAPSSVHLTSGTGCEFNVTTTHIDCMWTLHKHVAVLICEVRGFQQPTELGNAA
jgi:hypothetical protein